MTNEQWRVLTQNAKRAREWRGLARTAREVSASFALMAERYKFGGNFAQAARDEAARNIRTARECERQARRIEARIVAKAAPMANASPILL